MIASDFRVFLYQHDEKKEVGMKQILKEPTREVGDDIYWQKNIAMKFNIEEPDTELLEKDICVDFLLVGWCR